MTDIPIRPAGQTAADACEGATRLCQMLADSATSIELPNGPSTAHLRAAGIGGHVARLQDEFDRALSSTWHGRLFLRWSRWRARRSTG